MVTNGSSVKDIQLTGEQVFTYAKNSGGVSSPGNIVVTAICQNTSVNTWKYKTPFTTSDDDNFVNLPTGVSGNTATIYAETVSGGTSYFGTSNWLTLKAYNSSDANIYDEFTIYKVYDGTDGQQGSAGTPASTVFLTNESVGFSAGMDGTLPSAVTFTSDVVAFTGTAKVMPTVGTISTGIAGLTCQPTPDTTYNTVHLTITAAAGTNLGSAGNTQGQITIPVTAIGGDSTLGVDLVLNWTKVNNGSDSVVMSLYAPNGSIFINQGGSKTISVMAYLGATDITSSATYAWSRYDSGWQPITAQTPNIRINAGGTSIDVDGEDVLSSRAYKCTMTYEQRAYEDTLTLTDKTDNYQANILSTGGDIFRNAQGDAFLICELWQSGSQVDAVKDGAIYVNSVPSDSTGSDNDYCYVCPKSVYSDGSLYQTKNTVLYQKKNGAWSLATPHEHTYIWTRLDANGNAVDSLDKPFAVGKQT